MQFIKNGPDIPERLLREHEDGNVVFFCGAGISCRAGLPNFKDLVDKLYDCFSDLIDPIYKSEIQKEIRDCEFDLAIRLLEKSIDDGRRRVREKMAEILLNPDLDLPDALTTHEVLLTLSRTYRGNMQLVTTNFDRLFQKVIEDNHSSISVKSYQASRVASLKNRRWNGLIYLHGLLVPNPTSDELKSLVLSRPDYSLAYLRIRWASEFITDMIDKYTVCFVGHSVSDPMLSYMLDGYSFDDPKPQIFAFAGYEPGQKEATIKEWEEKNLKPIPYCQHGDHTYLRETLSKWAQTYRAEVLERRPIINASERILSLQSQRDDELVNQVLTALNDTENSLVDSFAEIDLIPSSDQLQILIKIADQSTQRNDWEKIIPQLSSRLIRYLNDPKLLFWLSGCSGQLYDQLCWLIEHRIDELVALEHSNDTTELTSIRESTPNGIPDELMQKFWRLLLRGSVKSKSHELGVYRMHRWSERFKLDRLSATMRRELRENLSPHILIHEPSYQAVEENSQLNLIRSSLDWEITLSVGNVHSYMEELNRNERWKTMLPELLPEFTDLLRNALDLMQELDAANKESDLSYIQQPSISQHSQNRNFYDWTVLINLARDAWLSLAKQSTEWAITMAKGWWDIPYPLFHRLAFFAAAQKDYIPPRLALEWLLDDNCWWLWSVETKREAIRLLVTITKKLKGELPIELQQAIVAGPPDGMFESERKRLIEDGNIWLRLAKVAEAGAHLNKEAKEKLEELSAELGWELEEDERDEFSFWMTEEVEMPELAATPNHPPELIDWLRQNPGTDPRKRDDWQQYCRDHFDLACGALQTLAEAGDWLPMRWRSALEAWSEKEYHQKSWSELAPILEKTSEKELQSIVYDLGRWLQSIAQTFESHEQQFFTLINRILALEHDNLIVSEDPTFVAINHPIGHVTEALFRWWFQHPPAEGQGLPRELKPVFTKLCDVRVQQYRHGRVILANYADSLFGVDPDWATSEFLPLFDWEQFPDEASSVWRGFLMSPYAYAPLMGAIKLDVLNTANHYQDLGGHGRQYADFITIIALNPDGTFLNTELAEATRLLQPEGLQRAVQALVRMLTEAGEQRANFWQNRIAPYLQTIWPKNPRNLTPDEHADISEGLGCLCITARDNFPEALAILRDWLIPIAVEVPSDQIYELHKSELCQTKPKESLDFLALIIDKKVHQISKDHLKDCLEMIVKTNEDLKEDDRYKRLINLVSIA